MPMASSKSRRSVTAPASCTRGQLSGTWRRATADSRPFTGLGSLAASLIVMTHRSDFDDLGQSRADYREQSRKQNVGCESQAYTDLQPPTRRLSPKQRTSLAVQ